MNNLNAGDWRMTIKIIQAGQAGNYAPIIHKYQVFFEQIPYTGQNQKTFEPCGWSKEIIKQHLKAIKNWKFDLGEKGSGSMDDTFSPRLTELFQISPGLWQFTVIEEFCD